MCNTIQDETIALCGTRCVIIDIQAPSFTRVNSLRPQSQCLAKAAFCKAPHQRTSKTCPFGDRRAVSTKLLKTTTSLNVQIKRAVSKFDTALFTD